MELIRGRDGYRGKEVRGEIVRRGARATRGDNQVGQALGAIDHEGAHPAESGHVGRARRLDGRRNRGGTVGSVRRQLVEEGFGPTLVRKYNPNSARPRIFDGATEAKLIALACSPAPEGLARWSLRLLEEKVVELNIVEKASDNTIGRTLKKHSSTPSQSAMGHSTRRQRGLCRGDGRRAGNLPKAA
jgi:hypothetical protein